MAACLDAQLCEFFIIFLSPSPRPHSVYSLVCITGTTFHFSVFKTHHQYIKEAFTSMSEKAVIPELHPLLLGSVVKCFIPTSFGTLLNSD